jgi:hypothetical protein
MKALLRSLLAMMYVVTNGSLSLLGKFKGWLTKRLSQSVCVEENTAYLVLTVDNAYEIRRCDFTYLPEFETLFSIDLAYFIVNITVDSEDYVLALARKDDDKNLIAMAHDYSEDSLLDNDFWRNLLEPKLNQMIKHVPHDKWSDAKLDGCCVMDYQIPAKVP